MVLQLRTIPLRTLGADGATLTTESLFTVCEVDPSSGERRRYLDVPVVELTSEAVVVDLAKASLVTTESPGIWYRREVVRGTETGAEEPVTLLEWPDVPA